MRSEKVKSDSSTPTRADHFSRDPQKVGKRERHRQVESDLRPSPQLRSGCAVPTLSERSPKFPKITPPEKGPNRILRKLVR